MRNVPVSDVGGNGVTTSAILHVARQGPPPDSLETVANALTHGAEYYADFITAAYEPYLQRLSAYVDLLGRKPDAAGYNAWLAILK